MPLANSASYTGMEYHVNPFTLDYAIKFFFLSVIFERI